MLLLLLLRAATLASSGPVIKTDDGPLRGFWQADGVAAFHGVPFAAVPTGALRWKAPVRPPPWTFARDATRPGGRCFQADIVRGLGSGSEDCLYLSLYTPPKCLNASGTALSLHCPVLFWVHGHILFLALSGNLGWHHLSWPVNCVGV